MDEPQATDRPTYSPDDFLHDLGVLELTPSSFAGRSRVVGVHAVYDFVNGKAVRRTTVRIIAMEVCRLREAKAQELATVRATMGADAVT